MKMTAEHYNQLKAAIDDLCIDIHLLKSSYQKRNLSMKRLRWDILYAATKGIDPWVSDTLYSYLDDAHIDTALRKIVGVGE